MSKRSWSIEDRAEIKRAADEAGIPYTIRGNCRRCYEKILLALYELDEATPKIGISLDGWRLRTPSQAFRLQGVLFDNRTIRSMEVGHLPAIVLRTLFTREGDEN